MASFEEVDYTHYSGAQLLDVLDHVDRSRAWKNYEAVRKEIARRPAPDAEYIGGREIAVFETLTRAERRTIFHQCLYRAFLMQLQYSVAVIVLTLIAAFVIGLVMRALGISNSSNIVAPIGAVLGLVLSFAAFWAYAKWLLHVHLGPFSFALLREVPATREEAPGA